jgi:hypothetical protein
MGEKYPERERGKEIGFEPGRQIVYIGRLRELGKKTKTIMDRYYDGAYIAP